MKKLYLLIVCLLIGIISEAQPISISAVGVSGRFNSCTGSNTPVISANLISTSGGSSVSGGLFTCINPCDSSTIRVTLSNIKWNKNPNSEWLHGLFLPSNAGFSVAPVFIPTGFVAYNTGCAGLCPSGTGLNGGPGFYFDASAQSSCCGTPASGDGIPCNNFGDVTVGCGASLFLTFDITFCNSIITSSSYQFVFTGSSDGETGCYNFNDLLSHQVTFTIPTVPCTPPAMNPIASDPIRTCIGSNINYTSTLTATCNANAVHWWTAATGGILLGTGSPFVYDPAGAACPAGTTLYATCCAGTSTNCVDRVPVTIPGVCDVISISGATATNSTCSVLGAINSVQVLNAQGAINYTLMPGGAANSSGYFPGLSLTSYTVTATDGGGCSSSTTINITQPIPLVFSSPSIVLPTCNLPTSGQINISASGGTGPISFNINPSASQPTSGIFTGLSAQAYTITATDTMGCSASTIVNVSVSAFPSWGAISSTPLLCNGFNNSTLNVTALSASGALTYVLTPGGISNNTGLFPGLAANTYSILATDANGCAINTVVTISQPTQVTWTSVTYTAVSCFGGNNATINATANGGTGTKTYTITPTGASNSTGNFSNLIVGDYTITASDANGCSISTTVNITQPTQVAWTSVTSTLLSCFGGNNATINAIANGGTGTKTYTLAPTGASNSTGTFTNLIAGTYTITANDANGCSISTTVNITQPTQVAWTSVTSTTVSCFGGNNATINATANGGTGTKTYTITPTGASNSTGTFTNLIAGAYTISASDASGCSISTTVNIAQPTQVSWTSVTSTTVSCFGGNNATINATANGGTGTKTYTITPTGASNSTGTFNNLIVGDYTITASDANGCSISTTVNITQPTQVAWTSVTSTAVSCFGGNNAGINAIANGGTGTKTYTITPTGASNSTGVFTTLIAGAYTITASDVNGCSITTTVNITQPTQVSWTSVTSSTLNCFGGNNATINAIANGGTGTKTYTLTPTGASNSTGNFSNLIAGAYTITASDANGCSISTIINITQPTQVAWTSVTSTAVSCFGGNNATINSIANGGTGTKTYTLTPTGASNSTGAFTNLIAGAYTITANDANGCSISTIINITQPTQVSWTSVTSSNLSCFGGSNATINATANGGTGTKTYTITPTGASNSTGTFTNLIAGTYTITASDANGCSISTSVNITQPTLVTWTSVTSSNVSCFGGNNATINATANGGTGTKTYTITPTGASNSTGTFSNLIAGAYTITASDANGCSISTTINITQPTAISISNISNTIPSCVPGNDATLSITANGGSPSYTYSIGGASQTANVFTALGAGAYTITVSDANGCSLTSLQNITTPNAPVFTSLNSNNPICFGISNGSITALATGGSGINYTLLPIGTINSSGIFTSLASATYTVVATNNIGCAVSSVVNITQPTQVVWTSVASTTVSCFGGNNATINAIANGGTGTKTYTITPTGASNSTGTFTNLIAGTYTITASDANGCSISTSVNITQPTLVAWTSVTSSNVSCFGGNNATINATANGGTGTKTYTITPTGASNSTGTFTNLIAGAYTITASDANGCSISTTVNITQPTALSISNISNTIPSCVPGNDATLTITASGGSPSYTYSIGGAAQTSNVFSSLGAAVYTITVSDANGCSVTSLQNITTPNAPVFTSVNSNNPICFGISNGSIAALAIGGSGINYTLLPIGTTNSSGVFTALASATYTVVATNNIGCAVSSVVNITQPIQVVWTSVASTTVSCFGGNNATINAIANGGTGTKTYTITPTGASNSTGTFTNLIAGTYTITASDANGCSISTSVNITQPTQVTWTSAASSNVSCFGGNDATINATANGGTGTKTYTITPTGASNSTGTFSNLIAGAYTITASDANGCSISTTINITQPTAISISNISNTIPSCVPGNDATLTIAANGGSPSYTYSIGGAAQTSNIFSSLGAAAYTITVSDANGCSVTSVQNIITLSSPIITNIVASAASCIPGNDATIILTASGGTGALTYSANGSSPQLSNTLSGLSATTYTVTVADSLQCSATSIIAITTVNAPIIDSISKTNASCIPGCDATLTVFATGGLSASYTFSIDNINFQSASLFNALCVGVYTIIVKDANGCTASSNVQISTANGPIILTTNSSNPLCNADSNGTISLTANVSIGLPTYTLMPLNISNTIGNFNSLSAGNYTVVVSDINGCTISTTLQLIQPSPLLFTAVNANATLCNYTANGTITLTTSGGTGSISYSILPVATFITPSTFNGLNGNTTYTITASDANNCSINTSVYIAQAAPIIIDTLIQNNLTCNASNDGSIQLNASGGTGLLTYTLLPGLVSNTSGNFIGLNANTFTIIVSDANACSTSTIVTITQAPPISINSFIKNNISCNNANDGEITINCIGGSGAFTYAILPSGAINSSGYFSGLNANTYTLIATDTANCAYDTSAIIINPFPISFATLSITNVLCNGDSNASIQALASGGTGLMYTYSLNTGGIINTTGLFTTLQANTYTIGVTDSNNCFVDSIINITQPLPLLGSILLVQNIVCFGDTTGSLQVNANGGVLPYQYQLIPSGTTNTSGLFGSLSANMYTVQVIDSNACTTLIAPIPISQADAINYTTVTHQDITCSGDTIGSISVNATGGTGAISYTLIPNVGVQNIAGAFTSLNAGSYTVIATDANNCFRTTVVTIIENPPIDFTRVDIKEPICYGDSNGMITADAIGGIAPLLFQINGGAQISTALFQNLVQGAYVLRVQDAVGCIRDTNIILSQPKKVEASDIIIVALNCQGINSATVTVTGEGGTGVLTYYISPEISINQTGVFNDLHLNTYDITIKDSVGCVFDTTINIPISENPLAVNISKKDLGCTGNGTEGYAKAIVSGGFEPYTYQWNTSPVATTSEIENLRFGYYIVQVQDASGCIVSDTVYIAPGNCCDQIFIPNAFSPNGDGMNDVFKVTTSTGIKLLQFEIFDRWGNSVWKTYNHTAGWDGKYKKEKSENSTFYYVFRYVCLANGETYLRKGDVIIVR